MAKRHHASHAKKHHSMHHNSHHDGHHKAHHSRRNEMDGGINEGRRYEDYELYGSPNRVEGHEYIERGAERDRLNSRHAGRRYMHADSELTQEHRDAGMISNDYSKLANLPTEVMMKEYPPCPAYMDWEMEDNIIGIDRQQSRDNAARRRGFQPHKY